jgi:hypothetical protein
MDDRPRKDRLIQTRVPQDLESTLKDEARKRRLSVSHLIRNVLEDTFSLVDNVVTEVDRVVTDSVEMAATFKRDAARLAATARGHTSHREPRREPVIDVPGEDVPEPPSAPEPPPAPPQEPPAGLHNGPLSDVYGFQELLLNRSASCANCGTQIQRGARAYLGMTDRPELPRVWVCQDCVDTISE